MVTLNNLKTLGLVILGVLLLWFLASTGQSRSGANKALRTNGKMEFTTIYDIDTLYFTPHSRILSEEVLRALNTQGEHYVVVLKDHKTTKGKGRKR